MKTTSDRLRQRLTNRILVLGLTRADLARRSGLDAAAVERVLADPDAAPHAAVAAVGAAVGLNLDGGPSVSLKQFLRRAAVRKARYLVKLVQGTSLLEAQAVDADTRRELTRQAVRALLTDRRKIWS